MHHTEAARKCLCTQAVNVGCWMHCKHSWTDVIETAMFAQSAHGVVVVVVVIVGGLSIDIFATNSRMFWVAAIVPQNWTILCKYKRGQANDSLASSETIHLWLSSISILSLFLPPAGRIKPLTVSFKWWRRRFLSIDTPKSRRESFAFSTHHAQKRT